MSLICDVCRVEVGHTGCPDANDHGQVLAIRYAEALIQVAVEHGPRLNERGYWSSPGDTYWVAAYALGIA